MHLYLPHLVELAKLSRRARPVPDNSQSSASKPEHIMLTNQVWLPQPFAGSEELITGCPTNNEILCKIYTTYRVETTNERLPRRMIDTCKHRANEVRSKSLLV